MSALWIVGYLLGWFGATVVALRLRVKPIGPVYGCHGSVVWRDSDDCARYHDDGCWRIKHTAAEVPNGGDLFECAALALAWPLLALPAAAWLVATGRVRRDIAAEERRAALKAHIAELEREAGIA